jgi:two-component system, response regulator RpfG
VSGESEILVVDDSPSNTTVYERVVNQIPGHKAHCFTDPHQALAWAKAHPPALAVVDYRMPGIDGVEFIKRLRALHGNEQVPVAMLTAVASPVLWQMALDAGANAYLMKPINKDQFIETVQKLLGAARHV